MAESLLIRYLQPLLAGRRAECFDLVADAVRNGGDAEALICEVIWPAMAQVDRLYRDDRINSAIEHMASRINRTVADQLQAHLRRATAKGKRAIVICADDTREELGAQMITDLLQADGWEIFLLGGGVPNDEILSLVGQMRPHVLVVFGTQPQDVTEMRKLIETIREVGVCPTMNVIASGGVFGRADGLWEEVGADAFAESAREVVKLANDLPPRQPQAPRLGLVKKRRRRRRAPVQRPACP